MAGLTIELCGEVCPDHARHCRLRPDEHKTDLHGNRLHVCTANDSPHNFYETRKET